MFSENEIRTSHNPFDSLDPLDLKAWFFTDPRISKKAIDYPPSCRRPGFHTLVKARGSGLTCGTKQFQYQRFMIERRLYRDQSSRGANRRDYELSWNFYPLVRPGASWESPEVYLKFDNGDWHAVAKQHRDWLRPGSAVRTWPLSSELHWVDQPRSPLFDEIPKVASQGVDAGAPYFILYGWSQIGPQGMSYTSYPRVELGGEESLKLNLRKARELGAYPMAWFTAR